MGTVVNIKPRATVVFENDQAIRLSPNANGGTIGSTGLASDIYLGPDATVEEDGGITRTRLRGQAWNAYPIVSDDTGTIRERLIVDGSGNGTLTIRSDPEVPQVCGIVLDDNDNSITTGKVTVSYDDETATGRVDIFDFVGGKGPFYTSFKVKTMTSVLASDFVSAEVDATDGILFGPEVPDTLWQIVGSTGRTQTSPRGDPNGGFEVLPDGDAAYIEATSTSDQRAVVSLKQLPDFALSIVSINLDFWTKNIGTVTAGCELIMITPQGGEWIVETDLDVGTEDSVYTISSRTYTVNPSTNLPWTLSDINALKLGCVFKGETPAVEKRWNFFRCNINFLGGFFHPTIDGLDVANFPQAFEAVAQDPWTAVDDAQYFPDLSDQFEDIVFEMEDLPAEAISVDSVEAFIRWTQLHNGLINGVNTNDTPCKVYAFPTGGDERYHLMSGPTDQSNIGGVIRRIQDVPGILSGGRVFANRGDPLDGCGFNPSTDPADEGTGWGEFTEKSFITTLASDSTPITVDDVNQMECGYEVGSGQPHEKRLSRVFAEVFYKRYTVPANLPHLHLAIDDDLDSLTIDDDYMPSQHPNDKTFGCDFSGIPEASQVNSVTLIVRARTGASAVGWRAGWRTNASDVFEANELNTDFETKTYVRTTNPVTGEPWLRSEVNALVGLWQSRGENAFVEKQFSAMQLQVDFEEIPDKIDNARDIASRRLRLRRRPIPFFKGVFPLQFLDLGILGDVEVIHRAIPSIDATIGFERWDRSLMRVFKEAIDLNRNRVELTLLDLRDYLVTLWITGRTTTKGQAAEGMAVITPGVKLSFVRPTNDYFEDAFAGLIQELNTDMPPTSEKGILVQNASINPFINSHFSEGGANIFTGWNKVGDGAAGASIVEDLTDVAFEQFAGAPARSVLFTGADTPADLYLDQTITMDTGENDTPVESAFYILTVEHKDDGGEPMSVAVNFDPIGFADHRFRFPDMSLLSGATPLQWQKLPVRAERTRDRIVGPIGNLEAVSGTNLTLPGLFRFGVNTAANQINHLYGLTIEGGRIATLEDQIYPTSRIFTKTGPVVRDQLQFFVPNRKSLPAYPAELRGTFYVDIETLWDSSELPFRTGVRRYIYGLVLNADNWDVLFYDCDAQSFKFERKIAGVTKTSTVFFPVISRGVGIRIAARWISSLGELDEPPFSIQLFVDDIDGDVQTFTQGHTLPSESLLYLGSRDGTNGEMLDGWLRDLTVKQFALPRSAIDKLP